VKCNDFFAGDALCHAVTLTFKSLTLNIHCTSSVNLQPTCCPFVEPFAEQLRFASTGPKRWNGIQDDITFVSAKTENTFIYYSCLDIITCM